MVVPLALPKTLTYKWFSSHDEVQIRWWGRVWWYPSATRNGRPSFGRAASLRRLRGQEVEAVVDETPIMTVAQRDLFSWMATHYMCSLGEMVGAALPAGMKLESTTRIVLAPDAENVSEAGLDEHVHDAAA